MLFIYLFINLVASTLNISLNIPADSATPTVEFITLLATGVASPSLVHFLSKDLGFNVKCLNSFYSKFTQIFLLLLRLC